MNKGPNAAPETNEDSGFHGNKTGTKGHYSGEEYDSYQKEQPRYVEVGVSRGNREADTTKAQAADDGAIENEAPHSTASDAGHRAYIDEKTGEVYGSGAATGGGSPVEDHGSGSPDRG